MIVESDLKLGRAFECDRGWGEEKASMDNGMTSGSQMSEVRCQRSEIGIPVSDPSTLRLCFLALEIPTQLRDARSQVTTERAPPFGNVPVSGFRLISGLCPPNPRLEDAHDFCMKTLSASAVLSWISLQAMVLSLVAAAPGPTATGASSSPQRAPSMTERRSVTSSAPQGLLGTSIFRPFTGVPPEEAAGKFVRMLNPSLQYTLSYGDNLAGYTGSDANSTIHQLSPAIMVRAADRVTFRYSPTFIWYSSKALKDRTDHTASVNAGAGVGNTDLSVGASYSLTSLPLVETGRQTIEEAWSVNGGAVVALGERTDLDVTLGWGGRNTEEFTNMQSVNSFVWLRRKVGTTLSLSAGLGGSKNMVDQGADITSRQAKIGAVWQPGPKLSVDVNVGVDSSKFEGSGDNRTSPVYSGDISYKLTDVTTLSLGANRGVNSSYYANQMNQAEGYTLGLSQRLLGRLNLGAGLSWSKSRYVLKDATAGITQRKDEYQSASLSLSTVLRQRISVGLNWTRARNLSNTFGFGRTSTIWGLSVGWSY